MRWELILFFAGAIIISAGCLAPAHWLPALPNDKLLHFLAFGGLALLAGRLAQDDSQLALSLLGLFVAGSVIEALQHWVPGRKFCWRDMVANTCGIVVATLCTRNLIGI